MPQNSVQQFQDFLHQSSRTVAFTGAGISTESGISDYRSQGGLWQKYQPVTIQEFLSDEEKRKLYWLRKKEMFSEIKDAKPNAGHIALAKLEAQKKLTAVITQNIDGFHQLAGSRRVFEIHGTNREVICLHCKKISPFEPVYEALLQGVEVPKCQECAGLLKPNTISFGQNLNPQVLHDCFQYAEGAELMIAIGSTLIVEPAASIPRVAKEHGATLVIINRDETPLDDYADLVVRENAGEFLAKATS